MHYFNHQLSIIIRIRQSIVIAIFMNLRIDEYMIIEVGKNYDGMTVLHSALMEARRLVPIWH